MKKVLAAFLLPLVSSQVLLPLQSSSRWILDANGTRVKLRCTNWAGHLEAKVPEGFNKQPIDSIADWIKHQNFNCVRLTYSIEHALDPNQTVSDSFLGAANSSGVAVGTWMDIFNQSVKLNPFLANATTRDAFGAVVDALWARGVMTILDNHVSKASWCCNYTDGNGWWKAKTNMDPDNSRYFDADGWLEGLQAMATWANQHKGVVAMSLRNEMRQVPVLNSIDDWYHHVQEAGTLVHRANPNVLVVVGGGLGGMDLSMVKTRQLDTSGWPGKHVWEFHAYSYSMLYPRISNWCWTVHDAYGMFAGFVLEQGNAHTGPLILSEFGLGMTDGPSNGFSDDDATYLRCLVQYMEDNDADWAAWALQGSYYVRDGTVDSDEGYGLLTKNWTTWRNPAYPAALGAMWNVTQGP